MYGLRGLRGPEGDLRPSVPEVRPASRSDREAADSWPRSRGGRSFFSRMGLVDVAAAAGALAVAWLAAAAGATGLATAAAPLLASSALALAALVGGADTPGDAALVLWAGAGAEGAAAG